MGSQVSICVINPMGKHTKLRLSPSGSDEQEQKMVMIGLGVGALLGVLLFYWIVRYIRRRWYPEGVTKGGASAEYEQVLHSDSLDENDDEEVEARRMMIEMRESSKISDSATSQGLDDLDDLFFGQGVRDLGTGEENLGAGGGE